MKFKYDLYLVVDDQDPQLQRYKDNYPNNLLIFNKSDRVKMVDTCNTDRNPKTALCARHFIADKAKELGYSYTVMFDDDITGFKYRYVNEEGTFKSQKIEDINSIFDALMDYMDTAETVNLLSFTHSSFYAGGKDGMYSKGLDVMFSQAMIFNLKNFEPRYFRGLEEDFNVTITDISHLHYNVACLCVESPLMNSASSVIQEVRDSNRAIYSYVIYPPCVDLLPNGKRRLKRDNFLPKVISSRFKE